MLKQRSETTCSEIGFRLSRFPEFRPNCYIGNYACLCSSITVPNPFQSIMQYDRCATIKPSTLLWPIPRSNSGTVIPTTWRWLESDSKRSVWLHNSVLIILHYVVCLYRNSQISMINSHEKQTVRTWQRICWIPCQVWHEINLHFVYPILIKQVEAD